jgi:uncharacterized protein (DUF2235 family)
MSMKSLAGELLSLGQLAVGAVFLDVRLPRAAAAARRALGFLATRKAELIDEAALQRLLAGFWATNAPDRRLLQNSQTGYTFRLVARDGGFVRLHADPLFDAVGPNASHFRELAPALILEADGTVRTG